MSLRRQLVLDALLILAVAMVLCLVAIRSGAQGVIIPPTPTGHLCYLSTDGFLYPTEVPIIAGLRHPELNAWATVSLDPFVRCHPPPDWLADTYTLDVELCDEMGRCVTGVLQDGSPGPLRIMHTVARWDSSGDRLVGGMDFLDYAKQFGKTY